MKKETTPPLDISSEYLQILKREAGIAWETCAALDSDAEFKNAAFSLVNEHHRSIDYKAEHILFRDLVKVFDDFLTFKGTPYQLSAKTKFILIFLYEKLQEKDLSTMYDLVKLNELATSPRIDDNLTIIRKSRFFEAIGEMENEFVLPALLMKIKSERFAVITSFINRIAALIVKDASTITDREKQFLTDLSKKINNPRIAANKAQYHEVLENDSLEKVLEELDQLIGMEEIKKNVKDLVTFLKVKKLREEKGLKTTNHTLHTVFMGPPGTGKTTVARLLGRIFRHLGYLEKGHLVETDRAGMVAGYVGQTAIKADEIIKTAIDGVLFIDEAYSLLTGGLNDFGNEAVEILLKRMEDHRDHLVVVVAGYPDEMREFIQANPGLQSRFSRYFEFDHFTPDALIQIFKLLAQKADFALTEDAEAKLMEILERIYEKRHRGFGNARTIRNLFEKIIERQANRIINITPVTQELLITLSEEDVPDILKTVKEIILPDE